MVPHPPRPEDPTPGRKRPDHVGGRPVLDVDAVVAAALDEVAVTGLARLSVSAVARRLGVTPRAIYHYVADRTALAKLVVARWIGLVPVLSASADPRESLREFIVGSAQHFVRYRFIHDVALAEGFEYGDAFYAMQERQLQTLVAWGAAPDDVAPLFNEIARFIDGAARHYPEAFVADAPPIWRDMGRPLDEIAPSDLAERYPLSAHAGDLSSRDQVDFGIALFLDGLATRLPALHA